MSVVFVFDVTVRYIDDTDLASHSSDRVAARDLFPVPGPSNSQSDSHSEANGAHVGERSAATSSLSTSPIKGPGPICDILNGTRQPPPHDAGEYAASQLVLTPPIHPNPEISASYHEVRNAQDNEIQSAPMHSKLLSCHLMNGIESDLRSSNNSTIPFEGTKPFGCVELTRIRNQSKYR